MMRVMKMVKRNSALLPRLGQRLLQTAANPVRRNPSPTMEKKKTLSGTKEEVILLGLTVALSNHDGGFRYRWYGLVSPRATRGQKFKDGIVLMKSMTSNVRSLTTQVKRTYPSLLHEFSEEDRPSLCNSVALNSKFHLHGFQHVFHLDPISGQFNVAYKHPVVPSGEGVSTVVLDGKIYYFTRCGSQILCHVFDPNTNQWDKFPAPNPRDDDKSEIRPIQVLVYPNQKKLLVISDIVAARTFDVTTNSWERGWDFPSQVIDFMDRGRLAGEGYVIAGDLLYMFDSEEYLFQAYDLQKKQLLDVHGLENESFVIRGEKHRGQYPTYLFPLGEQALCLVASLGTAEAAAGLQVLCLKLHVQKRGDGLHVVIRGRDNYFIHDAFIMAECVAIKQPEF